MCQTLFQLIYMYSLLCVLSRSVVSDPLRPHGLQPARLLCPWGSPGKDTGVGCHVLLQGIELALLRLRLHRQAGSSPPAPPVKSH